MIICYQSLELNLSVFSNLRGNIKASQVTVFKRCLGFHLLKSVLTTGQKDRYIESVVTDYAAFIVIRDILFLCVYRGI